MATINVQEEQSLLDPPKPRKSVVFARLAFCYFQMILCAGILASYSLFQRLLTSHGTFASGCSGNTTAVGRCESQNQQLSNLYYISQGLSNGLALILGIVYDMAGPKSTGVVGGVGVVLAMILLFVALNFKSAENLLYLAVPLNNFMGSLASISINGFCYMFGQQHVALILGVGTSSYQASALMIYVVEGLSRVVPLSYAFLIMAIFPLLSIFLGLVVVPSRNEYLESGEKATGTKGKYQGKFKLEHLTRVLKGWFYVWKQNALSNLVLFILSTFMYTWYTFYLGSYTPLTNVMFTSSTASTLQFISPIFFSVIGIVGSPISGFIFDRTRPWIYLLICLILVTLSSVLAFIKNIEALAFFQLVVIILVQTFWYSLIHRFSTIFAPPELYGIFLSSLYMFAGIVQMCLNFAIEAIINSQREAGFFLYFYTLVPFACLSVICLATGVVHFLRRPPPVSPPAIPP